MDDRESGVTFCSAVSNTHVSCRFQGGTQVIRLDSKCLPLFTKPSWWPSSNSNEVLIRFSFFPFLRFPVIRIKLCFNKVKDGVWISYGALGFYVWGLVSFPSTVPSHVLTVHMYACNPSIRGTDRKEHCKQAKPKSHGKTLKNQVLGMWLSSRHLHSIHKALDLISSILSHRNTVSQRIFSCLLLCKCILF